MDRFLQGAALFLAVIISVAAIMEIDDRDKEDQQAFEPSPLASPTGIVTPTERASTATEGPSTSIVTATPAEPAEKTPTPPPPRTPTPEPELTPGPVDTSNGKTPKTGGGAVANGMLIAGLALFVRILIRTSRARSSIG